MGNWFKELQDRGLIQDVSDEERLSSYGAQTGFYVGFDPTAPSLQLGNLVPLVVAMHLASAGLKPYILFGGATGSIGDPSGKDKERSLLERTVIEKNIATQEAQVLKLFATRGLTATFVNNYEWTKELSVLEFLRDTGKHFTVNYMLAKEVVKTRLEGNGISYTEFSYMLLQSLDFDYLLRNHNVSIQFGGSDQWGNITAGLELIRRKGSGEAAAFSFPLLTNSEGKKFGKSEGGAIWLDETLTSPYRMHQFLLNTEDADSLRYLKVLTFIPLEELEALEQEHLAHPEQRLAQTRLADTLVSFIHGDEALASANRSRNVLFGGTLDGISEIELLEIFQGVPSSEVQKSEIVELPVAELYAGSSLAASRGEAKRLITQGGAYVNGVRVDDPQQTVGTLSLPFEGVIVLRSGKKKYHLVKLT
ncbi:MAG: tyrosine--tRNA ligase [Bdellovibrionales bacterium]|nr:tyrosine--tRNA ligase [Bdellovibrionales bacterium]